MSDTNTNFQEIKNRIKDFLDERNWGSGHTPKNLSMSIAIEAAELMEIFQWMNTEESINIQNTEKAEHMREELADVLIYCFSMANQLNLDVSDLMLDKIKKNHQKYPAHEYAKA